MSDFDRTIEYVQHHTEEEGKKQRKVIWLIFWLLLGVTAVEVSLGLFWKDLGVSWPLVKWTFIILTIVKAYYIVAFYMHLKHELKSFKLLVIAPFILLGIYLIILVLIESVYVLGVDKLL